MMPTYFENFNAGKLKSYSEKTILAAFSDIAALLQAEYNFPQGGCQQRAHISSLILDKKFKIQHAKIWLFAAATTAPGNTTMLEIKDKNRFALGNKIQWGYHVAPVVKIKKNNAAGLYVIDPALNKSMPIKIEKWFNAIANSKTGSFTYTAPTTYFFNCFKMDDGSLSSIFNGSFYDYDKSHRQNLELEKGIAVCSTAMHIFDNHIKKLSATASRKKLEDLKAIFGNATAIDCVVAQNASANTPNTTGRYVLNHYAEILNGAKAFFNEKLTYWTKYTSRLFKE
ncbi:protein-glutamine glutaminase family protein [Parafilimonas sp.]|uniref:protein-glutamine glutaminase family protein n=1 Tax=Parafilimonas sp. TaxID=1969739 RepID=UPI0039E28BA7